MFMFMFIYNAHFQEFSNDAAMCSPLQQFHYNIFQSKFAAENNSLNNRERKVLKVGACLTVSDREFHMRGSAREMYFAVFCQTVGFYYKEVLPTRVQVSSR